MSRPAGPEPSDFDRYFADASRSPLLDELFGEHLDPSTPSSMRGFCFITMAGFERIAAVLGDAPPGPLLDAACGRGGPGQWLAQRLGRPLCGIDISGVAIAQARSLAEAVDADATYTEGPLDEVAAPDGAFGAVVCLDVLHFCADPVAAASELARVARPGGMIVATAWRTVDGPLRLRHDLPAVLAEAGWTEVVVEQRTDWLAAQLRLYAAAMASPSWDDPAVQRLRDEGEAVSAAIRAGERLLVSARRR